MGVGEGFGLAFGSPNRLLLESVRSLKSSAFLDRGERGESIAVSKDSCLGSPLFQKRVIFKWKDNRFSFWLFVNVFRRFRELIIAVSVVSLSSSSPSRTGDAEDSSGGEDLFKGFFFSGVRGVFLLFGVLDVFCGVSGAAAVLIESINKLSIDFSILRGVFCPTVDSLSSCLEDVTNFLLKNRLINPFFLSVGWSGSVEICR